MTHAPTVETEEEQTEAHAKEDVALVPLGIPLLAGPGAIATVMVLISNLAADIAYAAIDPRIALQ